MKITRIDNDTVETTTKKVLKTALQCGSRNITITTTGTESSSGGVECDSEILDTIRIKKSGTYFLNGRAELLREGGSLIIRVNLTNNVVGEALSGWAKNSFTENWHKIIVETAEQFFKKYGDKNMKGVFVEIEYKPLKKKKIKKDDGE